MRWWLRGGIVLGSLSLSLSWLSLKSEPGKKHIGLEYLIELSRSCRDVDPGTEVEKDVKCFILQLGENEAVDANKEDCVDE